VNDAVPVFAPRRWSVPLGVVLTGNALGFVFSSSLDFEETTRPNIYRVTAVLRFFDPVCGLQCVEVGFLTDFYSAPWFVWWHTPKNEPKSNAAAVVHDWLVRNRKLLGLSLMDCHRIFRRAMLALGVSDGKARWRFYAVVACNWAVAPAGDGTGEYQAVLVGRARARLAGFIRRTGL
jgi:hypothetical protein